MMTNDDEDMPNDSMGPLDRQSSVQMMKHSMMLLHPFHRYPKDHVYKPNQQQNKLLDWEMNFEDLNNLV